MRPGRRHAGGLRFPEGLTIAAVITGTAYCIRSHCTATWPRDPVLEVSCPDCGAGIGVRCRRPSGHEGPFIDLHVARDMLANACGA